MQLSHQHITDFQSVVWGYYEQSGRHTLPWRQPEADGSFSPYKITVSELMLQQTQVSRVIPKYKQFLQVFPTVDALAKSSLAAVLTAWSGLGYNRRAKYLHIAAQMIQHDFAGVFPRESKDLTALPGIGPNTAGAILAYAYNQQVVFIETNIRTVYFHHFLQGRGAISDREVHELVRKTLDPERPREWYWALMDYGASLKASGLKLNTLSKHYTKQSKFEGSRRQIRGKVLRLLTLSDLNESAIKSYIPDDRLNAVIDDLLNEGLIIKKSEQYHLSD